MLFSPSDIETLVPPCYAGFRPLIHDGLGFFLSGLPADRISAILERLVSLPPDASAAQRAVVVMHECPTLHKLGQVVARNPNMDPAFRQLLQQLETFAPKVPMGQIEERLRNDLGSAAARYRIELDAEPLAEASVAVVIGCRWKTPSGRGPAREGVLKILKPGIEARLRDELALFARAADFLDDRRATYALPDFQYRETFDSVRAQLQRELQLEQEQKNLRAARRALAGVPGAFVPKVLPFSTRHITAMERVHGGPLTTSVRARGTRSIPETLVDAMVASVLVSSDAHVLFHADPHAGNLMAMVDDRIAILDWSLAGRLKRSQREAMARVVLGAVRLDAARIADAIRDLAARKPAPGALDKPIATALKQVRRGRVPGPSWLMELVDNAAFGGVVFPTELVLFRKALFTLQGVIADVDPKASTDRLFAVAIMKRLARDLPRRLRGMGAIELPVGVGDLLSVYATLPKTLVSFWTQTLGDVVAGARSNPTRSVV